jgi:hypothetical protein
MDFSRDDRTIYLSGPAEAKTHSQRLTAAGMLLELDANFHARRLVAKSYGKEERPEFSAQKGAGRQALSADEITAAFAPQGWITGAEAKGNVSGESQQGQEMRSVAAQSAAMEMVPGQNAPKMLVLKGAVDARMNSRQMMRVTPED